MMTIAVSGQSANQSMGPSPDAAQAVADQAVDRVHHHVLPDQGGHRRHDEERRDDQDARHPSAEELLIEEDGQESADPDGDDEHRPDHQQRVDDGPQQPGVGEEEAIVLDPGEPGHVRGE
jgi:hypothetical protein